MSMEADVKTILQNVKSFRNDQYSMKKDTKMIRAEVLAISKDLFAIKRDLLAEDRGSLLTTLRAIEASISGIRSTTSRRESGLDKLRRIEAELEGYDFEKVERLYPEVNVRAALAAILEIIGE